MQRRLSCSFFRIPFSKNEELHRGHSFRPSNLSESSVSREENSRNESCCISELLDHKKSFNKEVHRGSSPGTTCSSHLPNASEVRFAANKVRLGSSSSLNEVTNSSWKFTIEGCDSIRHLMTSSDDANGC